MDRSYKLAFGTILLCLLANTASGFDVGKSIGELKQSISNFNISFDFAWIQSFLDKQTTPPTTTMAGTRRPLPADVSFMWEMTHEDIRSYTPKSLMNKLSNYGFDTEYLAEILEEDYTVEDIVYGVMAMMGGYDPNEYPNGYDYSGYYLSDYFGTTPSIVVAPQTNDETETNSVTNPVTMHSGDKIDDSTKDEEYLEAMSLDAISRTLKDGNNFLFSNLIKGQSGETSEINQNFTDSEYPDNVTVENNTTAADITSVSTNLEEPNHLDTSDLVVNSTSAADITNSSASTANITNGSDLKEPIYLDASGSIANSTLAAHITNNSVSTSPANITNGSVSANFEESSFTNFTITQSTDVDVQKN